MLPRASTTLWGHHGDNVLKPFIQSNGIYVNEYQISPPPSLPRQPSVFEQGSDTPVSVRAVGNPSCMAAPVPVAICLQDTVPVKSLDTPTHSGVVLYFDYFLHCRITVKTSTLYIKLSTCWLLFVHSAVELIPNHLNWVEVRGLWRPGHLMQHSITLLLGQIALKQPGGLVTPSQI